MKRAKQRIVALNVAGYTIVEVMMVLAVSSMLLITTMSLVGGRTESTRLNQSVDTMENRIADVINDVSTGYYPSNSDFGCTATGTSGTPITINDTASEQGTNAGCSFIGKVVQFESDKFTAYTMAGRADATSLANMGAKLLNGSLYSGNTTGADNYAGIRTVKVVNTQNSSEELEGIAIMSEFGQKDIDNKVSGNASRVTLYGYNGSFSNEYAPLAGDFVPLPKGAAVCLDLNGGTRQATLLIGANGQLSTEKVMDQWVGGC